MSIFRTTVGDFGFSYIFTKGNFSKSRPLQTYELDQLKEEDDHVLVTCGDCNCHFDRVADYYLCPECGAHFTRQNLEEHMENEEK